MNSQNLFPIVQDIVLRNMEESEDYITEIGALCYVVEKAIESARPDEVQMIRNATEAAKAFRAALEAFRDFPRPSAQRLEHLNTLNMRMESSRVCLVIESAIVYAADNGMGMREAAISAARAFHAGLTAFSDPTAP